MNEQQVIHEQSNPEICYYKGKLDIRYKRRQRREDVLQDMYRNQTFFISTYTFLNHVSFKPCT